MADELAREVTEAERNILKISVEKAMNIDTRIKVFSTT